MKSLLLIATAVVLPAVAVAQERTAGQAHDAQVNWTALKNSIDLVSTQNRALAAALDKVMACNAKKKVFAPNDSAADSNGCVSSGIDGLRGVSVANPTGAEANKFMRPTGEVYTGLFRRGQPVYAVDYNEFCRSKGYLFWVGANSVASIHSPACTDSKGGCVTNQTISHSSTQYCVGMAE